MFARGRKVEVRGRPKENLEKIQKNLEKYNIKIQFVKGEKNESDAQ